MTKMEQSSNAKKLLFGSLILVFTACGSSTSTEDKSAELEETEVYVLLAQQVADKNVWHSQILEGIKDNKGVTEEKCFYNMLDSSQVFGLFLAKSESVANEWCGSVDKLGTATDCSSLALKGDEALDINAGAGETYLYISHDLKDFDKWYGHFSAMVGPKEALGIYTLGIFAGVNEQKKVHVLARAESMETASTYGDNLEGGEMLGESGVLTTHAMVLRRWDYPGKK